MSLNLQKIPVPNKFHLHDQTGEVICTNLMKDTLKLPKFQSTISRLKNQLKQEKNENKTYKKWIRMLQGDLLVMDSEPDRGKATKKILAKK